MRTPAALLLALLLASVAEAQNIGFVYAVQNWVSGDQIYGFRVDATTGALTPLPGFPIAGGTSAQGLGSELIAYRTGRLFVNHSGAGGIPSVTVFIVNRTTGALTPAPFSPIFAPPGVLGVGACVAVHPSGSPVVFDTRSGSIASVVLSSTATSHATGTPFSTSGVTPRSCVFSDDGNYFYTGGGSGTSIAGFSVVPQSGVLTPLPGSPFPSGWTDSAHRPGALAMDRAGRLFTAPYFGPLGGGLRVFTTSGGVLTGVSGNPFVSGLKWGFHGVLHRASFYMVADPGDFEVPSNGYVGVYQIAGSGSATTLSTVGGSPTARFTSGGVLTNILALTPDHTLLLAANSHSRNLTAFQVNPTTGSLTLLGTQPVGTLGTIGTIGGLAVVPPEMNAFDRDVDTKADLGVFRPSDGTWWTLRSSTSFTTYELSLWGAGTDIPVPGDYDGDRKTDVAIFRPSDGVWWILKSSTGDAAYVPYAFGAPGDIPVPGDYDGDLRTDVAVYRPSTGVWWILESTTNFTSHVGYAFGGSSDRPVPADYDGDAQTDIAIFRPSDGTWYVLKSSSRYRQYTPIPWGAGTDVPVPGHYDGDGKIDVAVYRPSTGTWWVLLSSTDYATFTSYGWGEASDIPVPADYDGDGKTDVAFFRPAAGVWAIRWSGANYTTFSVYPWGAGTDIPLPRR